jgi:hypothetical protein
MHYNREALSLLEAFHVTAALHFPGRLAWVAWHQELRISMEPILGELTEALQR